MNSASFWIYFGIFASLIAAGLGAPIPEELPIVTGGALVGHASEKPQVPVEVLTAWTLDPAATFPANLPWQLVLTRPLVDEGVVEPPRTSPLPSSLRWWIMLPVCIAGVVLSDVLLYCVGRFGGRRLLDNQFVKRLLPDDKRERIESNFHRYGILVLLFARFLPTIRSPIFMMAGVMRLPLHRFVLADGMYAVPGVSLLFFLAFWFGDKFRHLVESAQGRVEKLKPLLILLALTVLATYLVYHFWRHPVATGDPREEVPLVGDKIAEKMEGTEDKLPDLVPAGTDAPAPADKQT